MKSSLVCGLLVLSIGGILFPDESPQPADLQQRVKDLEKRLDMFENEKREAQEEAGGEVDGSAAEESPGLGIVARYSKVLATFQLFGDVGFRYQNPEPVDRSHASFFFGSFDIFATARLGERFHVVSETLIRPAGDIIGINQERLYGAWTFNDYFFVKLGTEHLPIARWIRTYHHGKWLEPTIDRPFLARFEGNDGFLPIHYAGLELGGAAETPLGRFEYVGIVSNGRGNNPEDRQVISDRNDAKAFDLALEFSPACQRDLHIGGAFRWDEIPSNAAAGWTRSIREVIGNVFIQHKWGALETIAEAVFVQNRVRSTQSTFKHHSWYVQAGYRIESWMPYARFDLRGMERNDPFFSSLTDARDRDLDKWEQVLGVRYDFLENAAIKVELLFGKEERRSLGSTAKREFVGAALQLAWVF